MTKSQRESYTEILIILDNMEPNYKEKIPRKLIEFFEKNSEKDYNPKLNLNIPLKEQEIKNRTLALLALLNLNYWCETEEKKQELIMQYKENEKNYYQRNNTKFVNEKNIDNDEKKKEVEKITEEEKSMVEYKQTYFEKVINKLKRLFNKNK